MKDIKKVLPYVFFTALVFYGMTALYYQLVSIFNPIFLYKAMIWIIEVLTFILAFRFACKYYFNIHYIYAMVGVYLPSLAFKYIGVTVNYINVLKYLGIIVVAMFLGEVCRRIFDLWVSRKK